MRIYLTSLEGRQYYQKNAEEQRRKRREGYAKQKAFKQENEGKKEGGKAKKEQFLENERYAKKLAQYVLTREKEINEENSDARFCKKYCERYFR